MSSSQSTIQPQQTQPFCCKHCGAPIGETTGRALFIGELKIFVEFRFEHLVAGCGKNNTWRPLGAKPIPRLIPELAE